MLPTVAIDERHEDHIMKLRGLRFHEPCWLTNMPLRTFKIGSMAEGPAYRCAVTVDIRGSRWLALLAHCLPLREVDAELVQIFVERVAHRHDAERPVELDDRKMPELSLMHHPQRANERLVGMDRLRLRRHHFGQSCRVRVATLGKQPEQRVALGEDTDEPRMVDDE